MIRAYQETHLNNAQSALGSAFDYAVNDCGIPGDDFVKLFVVSPVSEKMENGELAYIAGKSGVEIAREIVLEATGQELQLSPGERLSRSREYWIGWSIAYYQWSSGRKYGDIFSAVSFDELWRMYGVLHEADVTKFADIVDARVREAFPETNLKRFRTIYGCTQAELARLSGVSLRSIQMYEQRNKDINKAAVDTVYGIAKVLGCTMEDLIER